MPRRAAHSPVMSTKELAPEHFPPPQKGPIDIDQRLGETAPPIETDVEGISPMSEAESKNQYLAALAFNEQPVTVVIAKGAERNAPNWVPCWVNGIGAEVWDDKGKRWLRFGWLPVNTVVTVKRKYLEVLARSRRDEFSTREVNPFPAANQDGFVLESNTTQVGAFTVRFDPAGEAGHEWYRRAMTEA